MRWNGENRQEAGTVQKLPETSVRPVAQEQVGLFLGVSWISLNQCRSELMKSAHSDYLPIFCMGMGNFNFTATPEINFC